MSFAFVSKKNMVRDLLYNSEDLAATLRTNKRVVKRMNCPPDNLEAHERKKEKKFNDIMDSITSDVSLRIKITTFNVMGESPPKNLAPIFDREEMCEIYAVGLQEIVAMRAMAIASSVIIGSDILLKKWDDLIINSLPGKPGMYERIAVKNMVGLAVFIYARREISNKISDASVVTVRLGMMRAIASKGTIGVRIGLMNTHVCFVCSHFSAGKENFESRNADFYFSLEKLSFGFEDLASFSGSRILNTDTVFWFGDLNYRLSIPNESINNVFDLICENKLAELNKKDQLTNEMERNKVFNSFYEGEIGFRPTYKFVPGSFGEYDKSGDDRQRMPAWCDRILFNSKRLELLSYESKEEITFSDHKPVSAIFRMSLKQIEDLKFRLFVESVEKKIQLLKNKLRPKIKLSKENLIIDNIFFEIPRKEVIELTNVGLAELTIHITTETNKGGNWLKVSQKHLKLSLLERKTVTFKFLITAQNLNQLDTVRRNPEVTGRVRIVYGDNSVAILPFSAIYMRSFLGISLRHLISINKPIRFATEIEDKPVKNICRELETMVLFLMKNEGSAKSSEFSEFSANDLLLDNLDTDLLFQISESLSTNTDLPSNADKKHMLFMLKKFLENLPQPLGSVKSLKEMGSEADWRKEKNLERILGRMDSFNNVNLMLVVALCKLLNETEHLSEEFIYKEVFKAVFQLKEESEYNKNAWNLFLVLMR